MSPKHDSDDESRRLSVSAIYRQLDDHLAADEESYDVSAGLERLVDWMGEEAPPKQATPSAPNEVRFTGVSGATWRYWTDQLLGAAGGFGEVYAGEGVAGQRVAVKVVQKVRPSGTVGDRLLHRELEIGQLVTDSGDKLLPVFDAGETDEALLLITARADGALADTTLPMDDSAVTSVMTDIASGLQQLHSIGIIHRDLKPANVLKHAGRWKLADFGIAHDEEIGTQNPTFVGGGSPPYMAPELWAGRSPTVKTDLYALGCVGFELLSGTPPYTGDDTSVRNGHLSRSIPHMPTGNVTLRNLITSLLAKDPGERPQDARAVLERLKGVALPSSPVQKTTAQRLSGRKNDRGDVIAPAIEIGVIDNDQMLLQGMAAWIAGTGDIDLTATATSVAEYLAGSPRPRIVILELNLGNYTDPADNVAELVAAGHTVIVMSVIPDRAFIAATTEAGAAAYITKNNNLDALAEVIRAVHAGRSYTTPEHAFWLSRDARPQRPHLSAREKEILQAISAGMPHNAIARQLGISTMTVQTHLERVRHKYAEAGRSTSLAARYSDRVREDSLGREHLGGTSGDRPAE